VDKGCAILIMGIKFMTTTISYVTSRVVCNNGNNTNKGGPTLDIGKGCNLRNP
jgi:hypothetical protein